MLFEIAADTRQIQKNVISSLILFLKSVFCFFRVFYETLLILVFHNLSNNAT
jgi:hypothetical protein